MRLKTISNTLFSLAFGIDIGIIGGLVLLSLSSNRSSMEGDPQLIVLGGFLIVLSWILWLLSWKIDTHSDAKEVKQW